MAEIIERRTNHSTMGLRSKITSKSDRMLARGSIFQHVLPEDLLKFGLIPEFIGRLPVVATLDALDEEALVRILVEPKNSLVKQFSRFFEYDGVELEFTDGALKQIAHEAIQRSTGARALRTIIEEVMLNIMYEVPSAKDVKKCLVSEETVKERIEPTLFTEAELRQAS